MLDSSALQQIFSVESAAWTSTLLLGLLVVRLWAGTPALIDRWLAWRAARSAERTADWDRRGAELKRIDERCVRLELAEAECRRNLAEVTQRLATLEGYEMGQGQMRQEQQIISAAEKIIDRQRRKEQGDD